MKLKTMTCSHQRTCDLRNKEVDRNWEVTDLATNYLMIRENRIQVIFSKVINYSNYRGKEGIIGNQLMEWAAVVARKATSQPNNCPTASQQAISVSKEMLMVSASEEEPFSRL